MTRDIIMAKYVNHPYMHRFLAGKVNKNLADIVDLIDNGDADDLERDEILKDGNKKKEKEPKPVKAKKEKKMKKEKKKKNKKEKAFGETTAGAPFG
jgi:RNA processing factor Prp31